MAEPMAQANNDGPHILRQDTDGITRLTLNRAGKRNPLSTAMMSALQTELDNVADDRSVRVVVLAARGPAFCAGHDLKEIRQEPRREAHEALMARCSRLMMSITSLAKPVIASVQGVATAAGCQLVASCDLAVAAKSARFATPGVNIGLFCSTPMVALSRVVGRKAAMQMLLTGVPIGPEHALTLGLINQVVEDEELDDAVNQLADQIARKSSRTVAIGKEAFYRQIEMGMADAYDYASAVMVHNLEIADAAEGIDAFLGKRDPQWKDR